MSVCATSGSLQDLRLMRRLGPIFVVLVVAACKSGSDTSAPGVGSASAIRAPANSAGAEAPVDPASQGLSSVAAAAPAGKPTLGATAYSTIVYAEARDTSKRLGYLRLGAKVARTGEPTSTKGCPGGWYEIFPRGFVCVGPEATLDADSPILRAASRRPDLRAPLPYRYGFVRAVLPMYLRIPSKADQQKSEFKLDDHLTWYQENKKDVDRVKLGAWDVPVDDRGVPLPGKRLGEMGSGKNSLEVGLGVLFGGEGDDDPIPFWLQGGKRAIPNVSDFAVPQYAAFADRARRFTGLGFVGSFPTGAETLGRRFAVMTDLRLVPTTKVKPDSGSGFHGVELGGDVQLPLAFVREQGATAWTIDGSHATRDGEVPWRSAVSLTGKQKKLAGERYVQAKSGAWLRGADVAVVLPPRSFPKVAEAGEKWVEVSIAEQTLTLWEGHKPVYATLVSTGKKEYPTLLGEFRIQSKHVTATMDSDESSSVGGGSPPSTVARRSSTDEPRSRDTHEGLAPSPVKPKDDAKKAPSAKPKTKDAAKPTKGGATAKPASGKTPSKPDAKSAVKPDAKSAVRPAVKSAVKPAPKPVIGPGGMPIIPKKGDGEYGVTKRRGEGTYQLRDVPYIEYFAAGQALHAAYWHDVFGKQRSHGCVNLAPVDAHRVFMWTEPAMPDGWHGLHTGDDAGVGTTVIIHE